MFLSLFVFVIAKNVDLDRSTAIRVNLFLE